MLSMILEFFDELSVSASRRLRTPMGHTMFERKVISASSSTLKKIFGSDLWNLFRFRIGSG